MLVIKPHSPFIHLHALVAVGAVVNNGQRLLKARPSDPDHVCYQLTDRYHHLEETVQTWHDGTAVGVAYSDPH